MSNLSIVAEILGDDGRTRHVQRGPNVGRLVPKISSGERLRSLGVPEHHIIEPANRREDGPLLRGQGTFIGGLRVPELAGALHAVFVRSTEPHALIRGIDTDDAASMPGVRAVFTGAEVNAEIWPLPPRLPVMNKKMYRHMLADDIVRFVGEPVAVVIATTRAEAVDAAEAVIVDYESLPAVVDLDVSRSNETLLHSHADTNVSFHWALDAPEVDPFDNCDTVVSFAVRHPRLAASPMEPRSSAAIWGPDGRCTMYVCSQRPAGARYVVENALGLTTGTVRAIAPDVGGGFGAKGGFGCYPEDVVVVWAARRLGEAVRWTETRTEAMTAMGHGRASIHRGRIGSDASGRVKAYEVHALQDSGAYPAMGTFITTNLRNAGTGVYDIAVVAMSGTSVVTNTNSTNAFRGAGRPEAAIDIERAMDLLAAELGIEPVEIRRRNLVPATSFPYKTASGSTYDSGDYAEALRRCLDAARYDALRAEQNERRAAGDATLMGIGVSCTVEPTGGGDEEASITVHPDGTATVIVGTSPHGQSHEHTFAAVVSAQLGIAPERVTVLHSDTDLSPFGGGTIGSRSAQLGGSSAHGAAVDAVALAKARVADLLEASVDDIVFSGGRFSVAGSPAKSLGWADVGTVEATHKFTSASTFAFGACVSVVEIDSATGMTTVREMTTVDDAGTILQPQLAEGQIHGGLGLAVGAAIYEEMVYSDTGIPMTSNFADYAFGSAAETPSFRTVEMETPSPLNPLGVKGVGESGTVVGTPAIQSAVLDALSVFGVRHLDMPFTPEKVWRAITGAGR